MRKLAIAALLVAGLSLSAMAFAQPGAPLAAAAKTTATTKAVKHHSHHHHATKSSKVVKKSATTAKHTASKKH